MNDDWCSTPLELGSTDTNAPLIMSEEDRKLHMQVVGTTGTGKTKFLEHLIRQDIEQGQGVCVIDPTGNLYNKLVRWCETHYLQDEREIILIDPTEDEWVFGFNPINFSLDGERPPPDRLAFCTTATRLAIQQAWGESKNEYKPLLQKLLTVVIHTLADHNLTLAESTHLMTPDPDDPIRYYLSKTLRNRTVRKAWEALDKIPARSWEDKVGCVSNRLLEFLLQPTVECMLSQTKTINFRRSMDEGQVVLINLATGGDELHQEIGRLIGTLIVNSIVLAARGRTDLKEENRRPYHLYIDECHRYLNDDVAEILDELRQFGLHLTLAHQTLTQLREDGSERIYSSIMSNASTKVVFRCPDEHDADAMAKRIFRGAIDLEEPKESLTRKAVVGQEKVLLHGGSSSASTSRGSSAGSGSSEGEGSSSLFDDNDVQGGRSETLSSATSDASTDTENESTSETESWSETFMNVYQDEVGGHFSLTEQYERKAAHIASLRKQHAIVKLQPCPI